MTIPEPPPSDQQQAGLTQSLRNLGATALGVLKARAELLVTEIEEERLRLLELLAWGVAAVLFFVFGLVMLSLAVVVAFWDTHRLLAAVILGMAYIVIAGVLFAIARSRVQRPRLFTASLEERAQRRHKQLIDKGIHATLRTLFRDLAERDRRDAARSVAPLVAASDAVHIDATNLSVQDVVAEVLKRYRNLM